MTRKGYYPGRTTITMSSVFDFPQEALEAFPYGLLLVDRDRRLVSINAAATALFERRGVIPGVSLDTLQSALALFDAIRQTQIANDRWPAARALSGENAEPGEFAARAASLKTLFWL